MDAWYDFHGAEDACVKEGGRPFDWLDLWPDLVQLSPALSAVSHAPASLLYPSTGSQPRCEDDAFGLASNHSYTCPSTPLPPVDDGRTIRAFPSKVTPSSTPSYTSLHSPGSDPAELYTPPELEPDSSQSSLPSSQIETPPSSPARHRQLPPSNYDEKLGFRKTLSASIERVPTATPRVPALELDGRLSLSASTSTPDTPLSRSSPLPHTPSLLESPFSRLGLCTPRERSSTPSPRSVSTSLSSSSALDTTLHYEPAQRGSKRSLSPLPGGWTPDTPTPIRFYPHPGKGKSVDVDLTAPKQPVFTPARIKPDSKTPPKPKHDLSALDPRRFTDTSTDPSANGLERATDIRVNWISHLSTDGGIVPSLTRLKRRLKVDDDVGGVNMFLHPPKKRVRESMDEQVICEARGLLERLGPTVKSNSMAHAVHTTNLLSSDPEIRERSKQSIIAELRLAGELGIPTLVIHLGSDSQATADEDRNKMMKRMWRLIVDLKDILRSAPGVRLAIENTTHHSPTSLCSLSAISILLTRFPHPSLYLCLDLAHLHISELDLNAPQDREALFKCLGRVQERIAGVHVGDSCSAHGARGERHANIGCGHLDLSSIRAILRHPSLRGVPTLLETSNYYRKFRVSCSRSTSQLSYFSAKVAELEMDRSALERRYVQDLINTSDDHGDQIGVKVSSHTTRPVSLSTDESLNDASNTRPRLESKGCETEAKRGRRITERYRREKKALESRIFKLYARRGESRTNERFKRTRRREMTFRLQVQGAKRKNDRQRADKLAQRSMATLHEGEGVRVKLERG